MNILIITENTRATAELCAGARARGAKVALISIGGNNVLEDVADTIYSITLPEGAMFEDAFATILKLVRDTGFEAVWIEPTRRLKLISGRLSATLNTSAITEVLSFDDNGYADSLYFGGAAMRKQRSLKEPAVYTIGSGTFEAEGNKGANEVIALEFLTPLNPVKLIASTNLPKQDVDLTAAKRVVAVGRGIAAEMDLKMIEELSKTIDAEIGCTRPITENEGWLPHELYIGISGVSLTPDVYLGIGISGQMQHTVGVNRSKVFIAINKDKNAPIFKQADYGLVADLYDVVPAITTGLAKLREA